jgi:hypothetical protein
MTFDNNHVLEPVNKTLLMHLNSSESQSISSDESVKQEKSVIKELARNTYDRQSKQIKKKAAKPITNEKREKNRITAQFQRDKKLKKEVELRYSIETTKAIADTLH